MKLADYRCVRPAQLLAVQCRSRRPALSMGLSPIRAVHRLGGCANLAQGPDRSHRHHAT